MTADRIVICWHALSLQVHLGIEPGAKNGVHELIIGYTFKKHNFMLYIYRAFRRGKMQKSN